MNPYLPPGCTTFDIEHGECPECGQPTADGGLCRWCRDALAADSYNDWDHDTPEDANYRHLDIS